VTLALSLEISSAVPAGDDFSPADPGSWTEIDSSGRRRASCLIVLDDDAVLPGREGWASVG